MFQFREEFECYLAKYLDKLSTVPLLKEAMEYSALDGGKRIRPLLAFAGGQLSGARNQALLPIAAAIEMIHCYSLVHDDLPAMDDDDFRRGKPSNHKAYDEATAILVGDALLTEAFALLAHDENFTAETKVELLKMLSTASGALGMIKGQFLDMQAEQKPVTLEELQEIHNNKTGALIKASIMMGYIAGHNQSQESLQSLATFAQKVGLMFQIQDDILDATSSSEILGKSAGKDAEQEKATYVNLLGIETAQDYMQKLNTEALALLTPFQTNADPLKALTLYVIERQN